MFLAPGPNPWTMLLGFALVIPPALVLVYGVVLCVHHSSRKPQTAWLTGVAIVLLVAGSLPHQLIVLASWIGWQIAGGFKSIPFLIAVSEPVFQAAGLALLLRAAFLNETPLEFDTGPPLYRNDDGPEAGE